MNKPALAGDIIRRAVSCRPDGAWMIYDGPNPQLALWAIDISPASLAD